MVRERPFGITILGWVYLALGILAALWSLFVFGFGGLGALFGTIFGANAWQASGVSNLWAGLLGIVTAVVEIVVAYGLLTLKSWGWLLALIGAGLSIVTGVVGMLGGGFFTFICGGIGVLIPIGILIYLLTPGVRKAFGR